MAFTTEIFRTNLTTILSLSTEISDAELDRAVNQAVAVLSRYFPRELVAQLVYNEDITNNAFTSNHGTAATLANKPIRFGSETVTTVGGSSAFARNTDYEIDYVNGTITTLSSGTMANATAHEIDYKLDGTMVDISSLLTEPTAIERVDVLRSDQVPQIFEGWSLHGDFLMITSMEGNSQQRFVDNDHIRIYYYAHHVEPALGVSGSFPDHLDELVLIGASGYALLIESIQQEHLTIVDLASARTSIGNIAATHTSIGTLVTSASTARGNSSTEIANAVVELGLANAELDKVDVASGPVDDAETELALIITALAIGGDFNTALDKVVTYSEGATNSAKAALDGVQTELDLGNAALDKVDTELLGAARNADLYLDTGDALINAVNVGRNAAELNRDYAVAKVNIASAFVQEAQLRFEHGNSLASEASQWLQTSQSFINEASGRLRAVEAKLQLASTFLNIGQTHQQSGLGYIENARSYVQAAREYLGQAEQITAEINARVSEIQSYLTEATAYQNSAEEQRASAEAFRIEAEGRLRDYFSALRDRAQLNTHPRASSVRQYASDMGNDRRFLAWERQGTF